MPIRIYIISIVITFCWASCKSNNSNSPAQKLSDSIFAQARYYFRPYNPCEEYYANRSRLDSLKIDYFNRNIFQRSLKNPELTPSNKTLLLILKNYLNRTDSVGKFLLTTDQPFFPIFTIEKNNTGVVGFPYYGPSSSSREDNSLEYKLIKKSGYFDKPESFYAGKIDYFQNIFDSLYAERSAEIFIYTDKGRKTSRLLNLGYYSDECLEYYYYPIERSAFSKGDKILLGSNYLIDLEYKNNPMIDSLIHQQNKRECYDCLESENLAVTFAQIKGVEDLYFTYADTFPVNDKLYVPSRALVMRMDDNSIVYLWFEGMDLFGCPCL
jgi:hypothetical protein